MFFELDKLTEYRKNKKDLTRTQEERDMLLNTLKEHEAILGEWGYKQPCTENECEGGNRKGLFFTFDGFPAHNQAFELKRAIYALPFITDQNKEKFRTIYVSWCTTCGTYQIEFRK